MSGKPYIHLYTRDWLTAPELRACQPLSRSLWIDLLCYSCLDEPFGYVTLQGNAIGAADIVKLVTGWTIEAVTEALDDLRIHDVFSVDRRGRIYSRRIVRAEKMQEVSRKNGKKGGNPNLRKQTENESADNPSQKARLARARSRAASANANANEESNSESSLEQTDQKVALPRQNGPGEFEVWYRTYPVKRSRGQAERAFTAARKIASFQELLDGVEHYKANKRADRDWKYPATWLNGKCWLDEPEPELFRNATGPPPRRETFGDFMVEQVRTNREKKSHGQ